MSARMSSVVVVGIATMLAIYRTVENYTELSDSADESIIDFCSAPVTSVEELVWMPSFMEEKDLELMDRSLQAGVLGKGGLYIPADCQPTSRIAILIPYRNRSSHLAHFLEIMHPFLQRQRLQYTIVVVNQTGEDPFLRGLMLNVGFLETLSRLPFRPDCFFLHDVDHIPERQGMVYQCSQASVLQFANAIDRYDYELRRDRDRIIPYGGVTAVTKAQFERINGFNNLFIGWGGEDVDFSYRISSKHIAVNVPVDELSRYTTMPHLPAAIYTELDKERFKNSEQTFTTDKTRLEENMKLLSVTESLVNNGISNSRDYYQVEAVEFHRTFTELKIRPEFELLQEHSAAAIQHLKDMAVVWGDE